MKKKLVGAISEMCGTEISRKSQKQTKRQPMITHNKHNHQTIRLYGAKIIKYL